MKSVSYMMIMVMLIGLGSLFVLKRPDGKPWINAEELVQKAQGSAQAVFQYSEHTLNKAVGKAKELADIDPEKEVRSDPVIYKWRDENGNWIYSDKPNPKGDSLHHTLDPSRVTIMAAEDTAILDKLASEKSANESQHGVPSALNPAAVNKLMKDAKNVQKLMDDRTKQLDDATGGNGD
ncbi:MULTISPECIES: DUF4124 domain-containing protein [Pseudoalteromonas]|uniref:DUF4124 domain-containing protein n=1 Tax=Pseudoalteromonas aurantia 208 TaxID=1314867 RepID=A0ABR9E8A3_9GAMM|nr:MULTISPECIES: DUF4124 domain-containing protein [Pseudoalteromonas]MBE0366544.1 hypothetical protein [Pseudoalteromonas aurantia 208]MBQ4851672.1 DUF4124 domain-containing protein [Pseudoalteromonas sp. MMG012]